MVKTDKDFYDRKIVYLDYLERGEKVKNGGFVKWETRGKTSRIQIHIRGLYPTDTLRGEIQLISRKSVFTADSVKISFGAGEYVAVWDNENLAGTAVGYAECDGVQVRLSESRLLLGQWREREALPQSVTEVSQIIEEDVSEKAAESAVPAFEPYVQVVEESAERNAPAVKETNARQKGNAGKGTEREQKADMGWEAGARQEESAWREADAMQEAVRGVEASIMQETDSVHEAEPVLEADTVQEASIRQETDTVQEAEPEREADTVQEVNTGRKTDADRKTGIGWEMSAGWGAGVRQEDGGLITEAKETAEIKVESAVGTEPEVIKRETASAKASSGNGGRGEGKEEGKQTTKCGVLLSGDKWEQLSRQYPHIHPFGDAREYLSITPRDFIILSRKYQNLVQNSFLLHGYYNYGHVILTKIKERDGENFYLGVPGVYFTREKQAALMFGFEGFEAGTEQAVDGGFGYYMKQVDI